MPRYEQTRLDGRDDGTLIQIADVATVPKRKSRLNRAAYTRSAAAAVSLALALYLLTQHAWQRSSGHSTSVPDVDDIRGDSVDP